MNDSYAQAAVVMGWELCQAAGKLLPESQKHARLTAMDFWTRFDHWKSDLQLIFDDLDKSVAASLHKANLKLDKTTLKQITTNTNVAISEAFQKPFMHLAAPIEGSGVSGRRKAARAALAIYQRRACWNVGKPGVMPNFEDSDAFKLWAATAFGHGLAPDVRRAYIAWWNAKEAGTPPLPVPPRPHSEFTPQDAESVLAHWHTVATDPDCAALAKEALKALSIPISQAVVERSFSLLSALSTDSRLLAGPTYVSNMMMLATNFQFFWPLAQSRARILGMKD